MCSTMALPQDILEEILSHLRSDFPSLKACSLTHPSFLLPSNRLLFAKVRVQDYRGPPTDICLELRKVLVASKYMTESIRSLILDFIWYPEESGTGIFPSLLQLLPNLQRLCIHLARGNVSILNAGSFPPPSSISSVRTLILDKILFDTASQLYSLLASFNNLEVVTLDEIGIEDTNATVDLVPSRQSCLPSTLELSLEGPVLEALLFPQSTVSIANLRVLSILTVTDQEVITTSSILSSASSSLEGLTLLLPVTKWCESHLIDLGHLSRLRSIRTSLYFNSHWTSIHRIPSDWRGPFPWAHPFFKGLPSSVEDIILQVIFCPYDAFLLPHFRSDWQKLDRILASHPWKFSVRLEIYIDYNFGDPGVEGYCYDEWSTPGDLYKHSRNFLQYEGLPETNRKGCLHFEFKKSALDSLNNNLRLMNLRLGRMTFSVR
ncbi:hypothetical protein EV421DRAFT_1927059 [Armillaria borealis]|uniref:F-box domain-containing protein n=1 Tax=Armillaria borealis TaxID=47425 RepID=A0AA39MVP1_9AGAR|nr:hypothetical protein EV421DRAFT_1927059 [Armillaria borealis]